MEDFVTFDLAKKLKEKGFGCKYPFAIYFGNRIYYDYGDLIDDKDVIIAPTISQVLKWLRDRKNLHICIGVPLAPHSGWDYDITEIDGLIFCHANDGYNCYEEAALAGIEYVLDNLI